MSDNPRDVPIRQDEDGALARRQAQALEELTRLNQDMLEDGWEDDARGGTLDRHARDARDFARPLSPEGLLTVMRLFREVSQGMPSPAGWSESPLWYNDAGWSAAMELVAGEIQMEVVDEWGHTLDDIQARIAECPDPDSRNAGEVLLYIRRAALSRGEIERVLHPLEGDEVNRFIKTIGSEPRFFLTIYHSNGDTDAVYELTGDDRLLYWTGTSLGDRIEGGGWKIGPNDLPDRDQASKVEFLTFEGRPVR